MDFTGPKFDSLVMTPTKLQEQQSAHPKILDFPRMSCANRIQPKYFQMCKCDQSDWNSAVGCISVGAAGYEWLVNAGKLTIAGNA